jgi:hypothetical protein
MCLRSSSSRSIAGRARRRGLRGIVVAALLALASPRAATAGPGLASFVTVSPNADFDGSESTPRAYGIFEVGVGVAMTWRLGGWLEVGLEPRYDTGSDGDERAHVVAAPVTLAAVLQLASHRELQLGIGLGPALALLPGADGSMRFLRGVCAELRLGYAQPIGQTGLMGLVQAGVRLDQFSDGPLKGYIYPYFGNDQLPFLRVGIRWF